jgi:Rieske Fe-S protein
MLKVMTSNVKACIAVMILAAAIAVPFAAGVASCVVGPIARSSGQEWVAVTTLESLSADSVPRRFPIAVPRFDAWSRLPDEVIGSVHLRRTETPSQVLALCTTNHSGCPVEFNAEKRVFEDPCWKGRWDVDGRPLPSAPDWGDLHPVRTVLRGGAVYVSLSDLNL